MKSFVAQWGIPGLRTFLAASVDEVAGEEIFKLTYRAERKAVNEIFKKFGELADKIESLESYLIEKFGHAEEGLIHEATEKLLTRGHQILKQAHDYRDNPEALEKLINSLDTEIRVFADLAPLHFKLWLDQQHHLAIGCEQRRHGGN